MRVEVPDIEVPIRGDSTTWVDVLNRVLPSSIPSKCVRQARVDSNLSKQLVKLDECMAGCMGKQGTENYKFGVLHCLPGQTTEEEMYNNESATPALTEFLNIMGEFPELAQLRRPCSRRG